jgi:hypothetical protein
MMEDYVLKWSEHQLHMSSQYQYFRSRETYSDVVFFCENHVVPAHKLVLAAGSSYFDRLFTAVDSPTGSPVLVLRDTRRDLLLLALNFMYEGEARVPSCDLAAFMELAESFEIKGLRSEQTNDAPAAAPADTSLPRLQGKRLTKKRAFGFDHLAIPPCPPLAKRMFSEALLNADVSNGVQVFPGDAGAVPSLDEPLDATTKQVVLSDEVGLFLVLLLHPVHFSFT